MHDQLMETFYLLSIAHLAQDWPNLHPLRDRALEKLAEIAKQPAHTLAKPESASQARPFQATRRTAEDK